MKKAYRINEIFMSLQGEGVRTGTLNIFIRFSGCNLRCDFCDTDFENYTEMTVEDIINKVKEFDCTNIIWTGGEPTMQLDAVLVETFRTFGYYQSIETNGTNPLQLDLDHVVVSPKVSPDTLKKNFIYIDEIRYPYTNGLKIPAIHDLPACGHYMVSPIFNSDNTVNSLSLANCIEFINCNPQWKLSLQTHKLINIQ